jgi:hypothetical protein
MTVAELVAKLTLRADKGSFAAGNRLVSGIKTAIAGIVAFKTVQWGKNLIEETSAVGDRFSKLSQEIGIGIEPLQQLGFAAKMSGSDLEGMAGALKKLSLNAKAAADGSDEQKKSFKALGINAKDLMNGTLPLEDALGKIADKIKEMPDGPKKTALAMKTLGRAGASLIPFLNEGSEGIKSLRKEFIDLGGQIDEKTVKQLETLNDDSDRMSTVFQGIKQQIVKGLLPVLLKLTKQFIAWYKANRVAITAKLEKFVERLAAAFKMFGKVVEWIMEMTDGLRGVFEGLGIAAAALAIAMLLPFLLPAAAIAALILIVEDLWQAFTGGESVLKDVYNFMVEGLEETITKWMNKIKGFFKWAEDQKDKVLGENKGGFIFDQNAVRLANRGRDTVSKANRDKLKDERKADADKGVVRSAAEGVWNTIYKRPGDAIKGVFKKDEVSLLGAQANPNIKGSAAQMFRDMNINVTVPPNMGTKEGAGFVAKAVREQLEGMIRDTSAATGGK